MKDKRSQRFYIAHQLSFFRQALSFVLCVIFFNYFFAVPDFFSNNGVISRGDLISNFTERYHWSLLFINGSEFWARLMIGIGLCSSLLALLKIRSRFFLIIAWIVLISVHNRILLITNGGDILLRILLLFVLFLPHDLMKTSLRRLQSVRYAILIQLSIMYLCTVLFKSHEAWFPKGTAGLMTMHLDQMVFPTGVWLRNFPGLLKAGTLATYLLEWLAAFFILIPFRKSKFFIAAALFVLHAQLALTIKLGIFPLLNIVSLIVVLPPDSITKAYRAFNKFIYSLRKKTRSFSKFFQKKPSHKELKFVPHLLMLLMIYTLFWNLGTLEKGFKLNSTMKIPGRILRLEQHWSMFSPYPFTDDGWIVIAGELKDGTPVNLKNNKLEKASFDRPKYLQSTFKNERWRKYFVNIYKSKNKDYRLYYGRSFCRRWNAQKGLEDSKKLSRFQIHYMKEKTNIESRVPASIKDIVLWRHTCFKKAE